MAYERRSQKLKYLNIKDFSLLIKQGCLIVWSAEKNTESNNPKVIKTKTEEWCFYQNVKCVTVKNEILSKSKKRLLSSLGIKTPLSKIPLIGPLLF